MAPTLSTGSERKAVWDPPRLAVVDFVFVYRHVPLSLLRSLDELLGSDNFLF